MFCQVTIRGLNCFNPTQARKALMSIFDCFGHEFANRDRNGQLLESTCPFRFANGADGSAQVFAVGAWVGTLLGKIPQMASEFAEKRGEPMDFKVITDQMSYEYSPYLRKFEIRSLVVSNHRSFFEDAAERKLQAEKVISEGLAQQIDFLDLDPLPVNFIVGDFEESGVSSVPAGEKKLRQVVSGTFRMNIRLIGPWFVGPMVSKGCGRIFRFRGEGR